MQVKNLNSTDKPNDAVRREILIGAGCVLGLFGLGAVARSSAADVVIRPPGASPENFYSLCIKCGRCVAACHLHAIANEDFSAGLAGFRTPVMNYFHGYCDFCNQCIDACPTHALAPYKGESFVLGIAEINDTCIALRTGGCTKCYDECPYDAITLDEIGRPVVDREVCNGCGKCVHVCPAHVFQSFSSTTQRGVSIVKASVQNQESSS